MDLIMNRLIVSWIKDHARNLNSSHETAEMALEYLKETLIDEQNWKIITVHGFICLLLAIKINEDYQHTTDYMMNVC